MSLHAPVRMTEAAIMCPSEESASEPAAKAPVPEWLKSVVAAGDRAREENRRRDAIKESMGNSTLLDDFERD